MVGDAIMVFILFLGFRMIFKFFGEEKQEDKDKRTYIKEYITELEQQTLNYQSNSAFVTKTLIEREIGKQKALLENFRMFISTFIFNSLIIHFFSTTFNQRKNLCSYNRSDHGSLYFFN